MTVATAGLDPGNDGTASHTDFVCLEERVEAINAYFADQYGTDFSKLEKWQQLCIDVDVDPVPSSIKQCKIVRNMATLLNL